ncbi:NEL-type E3 ubiquitin ligase domain-containing protein [Pseudomonas sp. NPDC086566]|uniref:NEL-type E3 ubiquitin ligase domain-containing protein n=1 Tax=Pseudomonas sp. NPDC086566 TaxID=3390647 RepID=UPI003D02559C
MATEPLQITDLSKVLPGSQDLSKLYQTQSQKLLNDFTLAMQQTYQDNLIAQRLPAWLQALTLEQLTELNTALNTGLRCRRQLDARLKGIQAIEAFCVPLLQQALVPLTGPGHDVVTLAFDQGVSKPLKTWAPIRTPLVRLFYKTLPLLEVALWNFTVDEAKVGGQPPGNCLVDANGNEMARPSAVEFAQLCRKLDLGARYQAHLDRVLLSPAGTEPGASVSALLKQALMADMLVDAYKARYHHKVLSASELQLIIGLCRDGVVGKLDGDLVKPRQLRLLGHDLQQIVVLDVLADGWLFGKNRRRVLVYIPGDPHGPWSVHDDLQAFARAVPGKRLREARYQHFFKRFLPQRGRAGFMAQVNALLGDLAIWATRDLEEHLTDYPLPLFDHLAAARIDQIKRDAASVLEPVAALDRRLQQAHHQRLASDAGVLLSLVGLFVPAVGMGLLALLAWDLLEEVFEGIESWREGDCSDALDHVLNVGKNTAQIIALAVAGKGATRLWQGAERVDALVATTLEDGSQKLWTQDISAWRGTSPAAASIDARGVASQGERHWLNLDGHDYQVQPLGAEGTWQLRPRAGHGPLLAGNGSGAWRLVTDDPSGWSNTQHMFRRFGGPVLALDDEQIDRVLDIHGLDADQLRGLHVRGETLPAEVLDTVQRVQLAQRVDELGNRLDLGVAVSDTQALAEANGLPGAASLNGPALATLVRRYRRRLIGQLYDLSSAALTVNESALLRMFPSLHLRAARELLAQANPADLSRLASTARVPLRLAEAARRSTWRIRVTRVHEALALDTAQSADLARVALGLLKYLPGLSQLPWQLFEARVGGPLLGEAHGVGEGLQLVHEAGQFRAFRGAVALGAPGELFATLQGALSEPQRAALALAEPFPVRLRERLGQLARQHAHQMEALLGIVTRPGGAAALQRLNGSLPGFALSGRGAIRALAPQALHPEVRRIYPAFSDAQVVEWLASLQRDGLNAWEQLPRLRQQLLDLEERLHRWHVERRQDAGSRQARGRIKARLIALWRRIPEPRERLDTLSFTGMQPGRLPDLPDALRFDGVTELRLTGMGLRSIAPSFMAAFPHLRSLRLPGNRLTRLPAQRVLAELEELDLYNNLIALDATQAALLASCERLQVINLAHNPLTRSFSVSGLARLNRLYLNSTGIDTVPNGLQDCPLLTMADLRDNRITRLPRELLETPVWTGRTLRLEANPLLAEQLARLRTATQQAGPDTLIVEQWAAALPASLRHGFIETWRAVQARPGAAGVMQLLRELQLTAHFRRLPHVVGLRVYRLLANMQANEQLCEELIEHVDDDLTCQDGQLWRLQLLEARMNAWQAASEAAPGQALVAQLRFGRRLRRLYRVQELVEAQVSRWEAAGEQVDPLEVVLGYQLALREHLELPIEADQMAYPQMARLDVGIMERIRDQVLVEESQAELAEWLVDQRFWQDTLEKNHEAAFEAFNAPYFARLERLEQTPLETADSIHGEQKRGRRVLMIRLTEQAMDSVPGEQAIML